MRALRFAVPGFHVAGEGVRFCCVGASGYCVNLGVFQFAHGTGAGLRSAATLAFLVAVSSNYALNRRWTFAAATATAKRVQAPRFAVVTVTGLGIALAVLEALVRLGQAPPLAAQACAVLVAAPVTFAGQKLWSFARPVARGAGA